MAKFTAIRSEEDVGIVCRVGSHQRFQGLFKSRYSDFHVNEIDLNGKIVQLTCLEAPPERKREVDEDDEEICSLLDESVRSSIGDFQHRLEEGSKDEDLSKYDPLWSEKIEIDVTNLGKGERTKIHKWLGNFDKLSSETVERAGKKYIAAVYETKSIRNKRRPASRAKYTHCTMYKEGVDTSEAIGLLSNRLRLRPGLITFCGTKDKYGKTTQRICISNVEASRLVNISEDSKSVKLGNFEYLPHHLSLGDLKGNHFKILLRDVGAESDEFIGDCVESLKTKGFINYFGLQRFGSYEISTHVIGKSILQMNWLEAFDMILKPKHNDPPFLRKAKADWLTNRDPNAAIEKIPKWYRSIESHIIHGLGKFHGNKDYINAFLRIPRNSRHLYIHSFQSFLWNQMVTFRIKEMGMSPVEGDLVYEDKNQDDFSVDDIEGIDPDDETASRETSSSSRLPGLPKVKALTAADLPNYTIYDVVIPIQGTQVQLPENRLKTFYNNLLKEQGLDTDCFLKFKPLPDQPKGAYRKLVLRPQNVSHKIVPYSNSDHVDSFIVSELDKLNELKQNTSSTNNGSGINETTYEKQDTTSTSNSPENPADASAQETVKDKKCVIVEFSLPSSSYATMALREVILSDSECAASKGSTDSNAVKKGVSSKECADDNEPEAKRRREEEITPSQ